MWHNYSLPLSSPWYAGNLFALSIIFFALAVILFFHRYYRFEPQQNPDLFIMTLFRSQTFIGLETAVLAQCKLINVNAIATTDPNTSR